MEYLPFQTERHLSDVLRVYKRAIRGLDDGLYDARQRLAWMEWAKHSHHAAGLLEQGVTLLAMEGDQVMGFAQLLPPDEINMLYVDPAFGRRGVGTALIRTLEQKARECNASQLLTRASRASEPVFRRAGFQKLAEEWVEAGGVSLPRMQMMKVL